MPSTTPPQRRRVLATLGTALFGLAGCVDRQGSQPSESDPGTEATPTPHTTTPETETAETPAPEPGELPVAFDGNVLSVDADSGQLFAVVGGGSGSDSKFVALDPDGTVRWKTSFEANEHGRGPDEPVEGDGGWGSWVTDGTVYLASGMRHEQWSVRAFAREDGSVRWSFDAERQLTIRAVTDDGLLVTGEEFFVPENSHDTPEDPLVSECYLLDRATGEATALGSFPGVTAAAWVNGDAYVAAEGRVVALDGSGGTRWEYSLAGPGTELFAGPDGPVAVTETSGVTGGGGRAVGLSSDGNRQWRHDVPASYPPDVLLVDGTIYAGGGGGVAAVSLDGTVEWRDSMAGGWPVYHAETGRLYTRSGKGQGGVTAYGPSGGRRWTFDPPANNAWPATVTDDAVLATAITGDHADEPFYTMYAVNPETGQGSLLIRLDTIFATEPVGSRAYVAAGSDLHAFEPSPGA